MATLVNKDTSGVFIAGANEQELVAERSRAFKKFSLPDAPDGRKRFRVGGQVGPVHYKEDPFSESEQFKEIDLDVNLTPSEDWDAACETNGYQVRFWQSRQINGKTVRYIAQFRRAGKWLAMAPMALIWENKAGQKQLISKALAVGTPDIDNEAYHVTWSNVFGNGIDFRYNLKPDEFFKTVVVNNKADLPAPTINANGLKLTVVMAMSWHGESKAANNFADSVTTGDLSDDSFDFDSPDEQIENPEVFSFKDLLDRDTWWLQKPKAWDSAEERYEINVDWQLRRKGNFIFALLSVPATALNNPEVVYPVFIDSTPISEEQVGAGYDDAVAYGGTDGIIDNINATWTTVNVGYGTSTSYTHEGCGLRFLAIPIPKDATIDSAAITLLAAGNYANTTVNSYLYCELNATPGTFSTIADYLARTPTSNLTAWDNIGSWSTDNWYESSDIASHVEQVVALVGWETGNDLVVFWEDHDGRGTQSSSVWRQAKSYDFAGNASGPKFNCSYTAGGSSSSSHSSSSHSSSSSSISSSSSSHSSSSHSSSSHSSSSSSISSSHSSSSHSSSSHSSSSSSVSSSHSSSSHSSSSHSSSSHSSSSSSVSSSSHSSSSHSSSSHSSSSSSLSSSHSSSSHSSSSHSSSSHSSSSSSDTTKIYSRGDVAALPADDTDLENAFTPDDYDDVSIDDGIRVAQTAVGEFASFLFKDKYTEDNVINVTWNGQSDLAPSDSTVYLQIYNRNTPAWETLDSDGVTAADTDFDLEGQVSADLGYYFDVNFWIACRIHQEAI